MACLKGADCKFMHPDSPVPGHSYSRPKGRGRGRKARPRGGQVFSALVAATALSTFGTVADTATVADDTLGFRMDSQVHAGSSFGPDDVQAQIP